MRGRPGPDGVARPERVLPVAKIAVGSCDDKLDSSEPLPDDIRKSHGGSRVESSAPGVEAHRLCSQRRRRAMVAP
jgi:hypothetical protein